MAICHNLQVADLGFVIAKSPFREFGTSHLGQFEPFSSDLGVGRV